jgi:hypothetical protein
VGQCRAILPLPLRERSGGGGETRTNPSHYIGFSGGVSPAGNGTRSTFSTIDTRL